MLAVRAEDDGLVGLAPLRRVRRSAFGLTPWSAISFIGFGGDVTPEYLDFIVRTGLETPVVALMLGHLLADPTIEEIDLQPFASHSNNLPQTLSVLSNAKGAVRHRPGPRCPILELPATLDVFLGSRTKNYKKKIGDTDVRCQRLYQAGVRQSREPDEVRRDLQTLQALHSKRWHSHSRAFRTPEYVAFHALLAQEMLKTGGLRLFALASPTQTMAAVYCFFYEGHYYFYQAGWDPVFAAGRVGLVLMHEVIQEAIREQASTFDFLRGEEPYKDRWATTERRSDQVIYWASSRARMAAKCRQAATIVQESAR